MTNVPEEYCRQKAAVTGSGFYYSTLYYPVKIKRDLFALHAFQAELEELITEISDPGVAHIKLGWWTEETQRMTDGQARHPVTRELQKINEKYPELGTVMLRLINFYEQLLGTEPPQNYQDLKEFLRQGPGSLWCLSARICQPQNPDTPVITGALGSLFAWFQIIQKTPVNQMQNRNFWPGDEISNTGNKTDFYAFQIQRLVKELETGIEKLARIDWANQLHALILARIIIKTCNEIAKSGYPLDREITSLTPFRKFWIAWRTHRKVMKTR